MRRKEAEEAGGSLGQSHTHISLTENDVNYAANYDEEVKDIPGITKVTLRGAGRVGLKRNIRQARTQYYHHQNGNTLMVARSPGGQGCQEVASPTPCQGWWPPAPFLRLSRLPTLLHSSPSAAHQGREYMWWQAGQVAMMQGCDRTLFSLWAASLDAKGPVWRERNTGV